MRCYPKRVVLTIPYEWGVILDRIKKDKFFNSSRSDMLRYILSRGLNSIKTTGIKTELWAGITKYKEAWQ